MKSVKVIIIILTALILSGIVCFIRCTNNDVNNDVYLVFNTDRNYYEPTKVAIMSAIINKDEQSIYHINVLCVDIPEKECDKYKLFEDKNVHIKTVNKKMSDISHIGNYEIDHHVTRTDLFKFIFSEIFTGLDKILYIDSDTLIRGDLRKLYNTDISSNYLAAVVKLEPEFDWVVDKNGKISYKKLNFYNCGVLLLNLEKFRKDQIQDKLIDVKNEDDIKDYQTQRVFNQVIKPNTIKKLSPVYNDLSRWNDSYIKQYHYYKTYFPYSIYYNNIEKLDEKAVIVHYAGKKKPWNNKSVKYIQEWNEYARIIKTNANWKRYKK